MSIGLQVLLFVSGIVYLFILFAKIIKGRYNIFEHIIFLVYYLTIVFLINKIIFPIEIGSLTGEMFWTIKPFESLQKALNFIAMDNNDAQKYGYIILSDILFYYINSFSLAVIFSFCLPVISDRRTLRKVLCFSIIFIFSMEIAGELINLLTSNYNKVFNAEVLLIHILGIFTGYLIYKLLRNKILLLSKSKD